MNAFRPLPFMRILLIAFLAAIPSKAVPPVSPPLSGLDSATKATEANSTLGGAPSASAIYLPVASHLESGKHTVAIIVYDAAQQIRLMQKTEIRIPVGADSVSVELLPGREDLRARFAAQPGRDGWTVVMRIDGKVEGQWMASEFGTSSATSIKTDRLAVNLRNVNTIDLLGDPGRPIPGQNKGFLACRNACNNAFRTCDNNCVSRPIPNCEQNCDNRLANCLATCVCPSTTTYDTVSFEYTNRNTSVCMDLDTTCLTFSTNGYQFNLFNQRARTDTHTRSENCDGTVTDTVTATSYSPWSICGRYAFNSLGQRKTCSTYPVPGYCPYNTCAIQ